MEQTWDYLVEMNTNQSQRPKMNNLVLIQNIEDEIKIITLNRPKVLNALNSDLLRALTSTFKQLRSSNDTKVVILTGAGRSFCAGVDLTTAMSVFKGDSNVIQNQFDIVGEMRKCKFPIIGAINGYAITGGFELALACDILIASENTIFKDTHAKFCIAPSWGMSQILPRLIGPYRAKEVSLTARDVPAQLAYEWGIVNRVVPVDQLLSVCVSIAKQIAGMNPDFVKRYKSTICDGFEKSLETGLKLERERAQEYYKSMTPEMFQKMKHIIMKQRSRM